MTSQFFQFVLRILGTAVLARLLSPEDYGIIGMVTVVVNFAQMFKDAGLSMATVQKDNISHDQISTLFWLNLLISGLLCVFVMLGAPLVSLFYDRPELTTVTAALSVSFIIGGLVIQHQALLRRHMKFGILAGILISSQVINLIVTIVLALLGFRYWALVVGSIAQTTANALITFFYCPWIPGRIKRGTGVREMLKFGGHLTGFNCINYFSRNADNILIGKFIGADALGLYARAYQLFMMPISQIRAPLDQVAMPILSTLRLQPTRYARYYHRILDIMATLVMPLTLYCAIEANFLIKVFLGSPWLGAVPVFRVLAIAGLVQTLAGTRGLVLVSCGFSKRYFYWGLFNAILTVTSFFIGLPYGIEGMAVSYTVANYIILVPSLFYCFYNTPITVQHFLKSLISPFLVSLVSSLVLLIVMFLIPSDSFVIHILYTIIFFSVAILLSSFRIEFRETISIILNDLPRKNRKIVKEI